MSLTFLNPTPRERHISKKNLDVKTFLIVVIGRHKDAMVRKAV